MACGVRRLAVCLVCCGAGLMGSSAVAFGAGASSVSGPDSSSSSLEGSLGVPGMQVLDGGEQAQDAKEAQRSSPEAVVAREESELRYAGLNGVEAGKLAREAFPAVIEEPGGGPPQLSAGERIVGFPAVNAARVELSGGERGVIESLGPMAVETVPGRRVPVDLSLSEVGGAFEPRTPLVGVRVPKRLGDGVELPEDGVSVTPVNVQGSPLDGSEGSVDGATVMYANTQTDTDTVVKPTTAGFAVDTLLRSVESPQQLEYKVGLPQGASLIQEEEGSGAVRVVDDGQTLAVVVPPTARDAEGTTVPVSIKLLSDNVVAVAVATFGEGSYRFPIAVDPEVQDPVFSNNNYEGDIYRTGWYFAHSEGGNDIVAPTYPEKGEWLEEIKGGHTASEWGGLFYTTRGVSQITEAKAEGHWNDSAAHIQNYMVLYAPLHLESYSALPAETGEGGEGLVCAPEKKCSGTVEAGSAENNNTAAYEQESFAAGGPGFNGLRSAFVEIKQEESPTIEFNKSSTTIYNEATKEYIPNVLYGSGSWLGPHSGAFEVRAKDPGVGISRFMVSGSLWGNEKAPFEEGGCFGIQCPEYINQGYIYNNKMTNGEEEVVANVEDAASLYASVNPLQKIKVDAMPPHAIKISGFQNGNELPMGEVHMKVEATDGEGATKSSGIKSIKISVDGHEVTGSAATCPEGPCTGSTEFTLAARDYTSGQHTMIITATDNANNVAQEEFTFRVGGASPVSIGPGSVDPSDGQLTLNSNDVSLGGTSGISRTYQSRNLTAGVEGPLGPQWAINLGGSEGLTVLPSGNALLNAANGASTTFVRNEKGEFESPKGDNNLKLESKEKVPGKGISEYVLTDPLTGTKTKFEQPAAAQGIAPTYVGMFGSEAGQLKHPISDAIDSAGNVWAVSNGSDLVEKFSSTGTLMATYGSEGTAGGQFIGPWGIAVDPRNEDVYVTDQANNRVEELSSSGSFIKMFGWSVGKAGKAEFEICTKECKPGIAGSGNGQFSNVAGVSVDSNGNVWVADFGNNRVQEFNEKGEYLKKFGAVGKGTEQFEGPTDIAFSGGNLYITDYHNNRVQEFSTAGVHLGMFGEGGSETGKFSDPYGIASDPRTGDLYVVDSGNSRVQEFTPAGTFITKFGSSGGGSGQFTIPQGIAVNASGNIYVVDNGTNNVDEWMRPTWLPTEAGGPLAASATTYAYTTVEEEGKAVMQPTEALAPIPVGVSSCTPLAAGCRSLSFEYGKETTAKGESSSEWGNYKGHLEKVWFHAYNPSSKGMTKTEVARYEYDSKGRLRVEWDPRLEHPLKTVYGYDAEGHVTALTPPGQESWTFTYGTIAGDSNAGRLLKVTRAPASAELWNGEPPHNTEAPKLSGSPIVGIRMSVSNGKWSSSPMAYAYQWEDCNTKGEACTPILGATNESYTVASSDVSHTLAVLVSAINGGGSVAATSSPSGVIEPVETDRYSLGSSSYPHAIAVGPDKNIWVSMEGTDALEKMSTSGVLLEKYYLPGDANSIVAGPDGKVWFTNGEKEEEPSVDTMATSGGAITKYKLPEYEVPYGITVGSDGNLWSTDYEYYYGFSHIEKITTAGKITEYALPSHSIPMGITAGPDKNLWFTEYSSSRIGKITTAGVITEYSLPKESRPTGIAAGPDGNLWFTDYGTGKIGKITTAGTITEYSLPKEKHASQIAAGQDGNLWFTGGSDNDIGKITTSGVMTEYSEGSSSSPADVTSGPDGNIWFTESSAGDVSKVILKPSEGIVHTPQSGSTIEYNAPVSGTGAPYTLSKEEVEKWGQKDDPVEAAAIFPPDEPQGWPASGYTRATIHYWDTHGRSVNTAVPTKGISTSEYNNSNETTRTLSADDRALAMKEGCKSLAKKECKSEEASEKLDTKTEYNPEENQIIKTTGPEHEIKLSTGEEVQARAVTHDYYDEGAKEAEEKNKETYDLLTRMTSGALLSGGEEKDVRTTTTSYSGQKDMGWKLRKATSTTVEPAGLDLIHKTVYEESTGDVIETRAPAGSSEQVSPPSFSLHFGGSGTGNGQFKEPWAVALDSSGNVWALDTGNDRVEKFSSAGVFSVAYGKEGAGNLQFKEPRGISINQTAGNIYIADTQNNRIEELNSSGAFIETIGWGVSDGKTELEVCKSSCKAGIAGSGNGQFSSPGGITIDAHGDIWVVDTGNDRVQELSEAGAYLSQFGSKGSGSGQFIEPATIAISEGSLYIVDHGNNRVEQFSMSGTYVSQFGSKGTGAGQFEEPNGIASNQSTGVLYVCDTENGRMEEFSPAGKFLTEWGTWGPAHEQSWPRDVAVGSSGDMYIIDHGVDEVGEWIPPEAGGAHLNYSTQFGSKGSGSDQFDEPEGAAIDGQGNLWVVDNLNNRIEKLSAQGGFLAAYGKLGSGEVQFHGPTRIAINKSTGNLYVTDMWNNRVEELSSSGTYVASFGTSGSGTLKEPDGVAIDSSGNVWVADRGNDRIVEFSSTGTYIAAYGKEGSGEDQFNQPDGIAISGENVYVSDPYNHRVEELTNKGVYVRTWGYEGNGSGEFWSPAGITTDAAGNLYIVDYSADHVEEFSPSGTYRATFSSEGSGEGQLTHPVGDAIDPAGDLYIVDAGDNRIEKWDSNEQAAHDTQTIYYSAEANSTYPHCGKHPEWANLVCQTQPAAQPDHGLPELPVTTIASYNIWDEAETTEEKFGTGAKAVTRIKAQTYDPAGRALTSEEATSPATDQALPKVTNEYNTSTGALEKQSTSEGTITSKDNTLGQLVESTDASGNVAKYVYEEGGDGRLMEVSEGKGEEAKSSQAYVYNNTTGFMEKLVDSAAGTFRASYDVEGKMTSEVYPNNMTATYTINPIGQSTSLIYEKNADCASKCPEVWFGDGVVPSVHGETLQQTSTLSKENYAYDNAGRLLETQETPVGKGCATRLYAYDEESNRTSLTAREPGAEGKCATEGGAIERHTYDEANRLTDEGVEYEAFSNTTKLPASEAGGHELVSAYYVDNQVASQEQNKELIDYRYDPAGRTMETASENKETKAKTTVISHYGSGSALTWASEGAEKWTRNIPGIDGALDAIQESGKTPLLELHDLQGDIVGTVTDSESETKLFSTYNSTEFGVPTTSSPPKYSWLGADGVASELTPTGVSTQNGSSYVPEIGRPLQTGPIASPGSFPNGTGGVGIIRAPYLGAENGQLKEISLQIAASNEEAKKLETYEREGICEKYPDGSLCHVDGPGEGNCETHCWVNEEEYYYDKAQAIAEEGSNEEGGNATIASLKLRLSVGCLEAGFWTYCSGEHNGKWTYGKVASNSPFTAEGLSTGVRVGAGVTGTVMVLGGGGSALACGLVLSATPEDGQVELVPGELHCMAVGAGALLSGGFLIYKSIFG